MLTKVEVTNKQGSLLTLVLNDISNGFAVESIDGLGPVNAVMVTSSFARQDGLQYHASRRDARNMKFRIGLHPDYSTETVRILRQRLYSFFMPKSEVSMRFFLADGLTVIISGRVESNEPAIFTQDPAIDISIMCFEPDFIDPTPVIETGLTATATGALTNDFVYAGTVSTGVKLVYNVTQAVNEFTFYHQLPGGELRQMDFAFPLLSGDVLTINTVPGDKYATLTRAGVDSSVLYGVSPYAHWMELEEGVNYMRLYTGLYGDSYSIEYVTRYGGL